MREIVVSRNYWMRILTGVFWTITYVLIIYVGFRYKICVMPVFALFANISWEIFFSFSDRHSVFQRHVNGLWLILDLIIYYQFIAFSGFEFLNKYQRIYSLALSLILIFVMFVFMRFIVIRFDNKGLILTFVLTLIMSLLFFTLNVRGIYMVFIAFFKLLGDFFASVDNYFRNRNNYFLASLYVTILFVDLAYLLKLLFT